MSRPAGVPRSSPSLRLTRSTSRASRSSNSAVSPLAVRPRRSSRQTTTRATLPAATSARRRLKPGRSMVLPVNLSRYQRTGWAVHGLAGELVAVPADGLVGGLGLGPALQVGLLAVGVLGSAGDAGVDGGVLGHGGCLAGWGRLAGAGCDPSRLIRASYHGPDGVEGP